MLLIIIIIDFDYLFNFFLQNSKEYSKISEDSRIFQTLTLITEGIIKSRIQNIYDDSSFSVLKSNEIIRGNIDGS